MHTLRSFFFRVLNLLLLLHCTPSFCTCTDCCEPGGSCAAAFRGGAGICCGEGQCCPLGAYCMACGPTYRCANHPHAHCPAGDESAAAWHWGALGLAGSCVELPPNFSWLMLFLFAFVPLVNPHLYASRAEQSDEAGQPHRKRKDGAPGGLHGMFYDALGLAIKISDAERERAMGFFAPARARRIFNDMVLSLLQCSFVS